MGAVRGGDLHSLVIGKCVTTKSSVRLRTTGARSSGKAIEIDVVRPSASFRHDVSNSLVSVLPDGRNRSDPRLHTSTYLPVAPREASIYSRVRYTDSPAIGEFLQSSPTSRECHIKVWLEGVKGGKFFLKRIFERTTENDGAL